MDHNVPSALVLNLRQTPLSYVSPGKHTFSSKGSKNVPIKGLDDRRQITATFVVSATGSFLPIQLIYQSKSKRCLPKFTFLSNFHITFTPNYWSNLEKCEDIFKVIIFPKRDIICPPIRRGLATQKTSAPWLLCILSKVKTIKKWNDYVQRITMSWLSFHTISRTSSSLWILGSINQKRKSSQASSAHVMLIQLANNCQTECHLEMLKYPSNWVIWNLSMLGWLLRHKWFHYQRFQCCGDQRGYHPCKRCLRTSRKLFRWTETTTSFLVAFSIFFHENINLFDLLNQLNFLFFAKYTSHCPFFEYRYVSEGSNDVKNKKKALTLEH